MSLVTARGVALSLSAAPILIYPGILIAGVMSLGAAGHSSKGSMAFDLFIYYSLLYPLVWYVAARIAKPMPPNTLSTAAVALLPLVILAALAAENNMLTNISQAVWTVITQR